MGSIWSDFDGENTTQPAGCLEDNTARVDPLDNLKDTESTAFMGKFSYIIVVGSLLGGLGYAQFLLAVSICTNKRKKSKSKL